LLFYEANSIIVFLAALLKLYKKMKLLYFILHIETFEWR
jgi:hypothetical protein